MTEAAAVKEETTTKADAPKLEKAKAAPKKEAASKSNEAQKILEQRAALFKAHVFKQTGHRPIEPSFSTHPHIDSGSLVINTLVGGSPTKDGKGQVCPGYPRRKITEIYGPESSGKTTIALCAAADVQRKGGQVLFLDFEHSLHHGYAQTIGVKFDGITFQHFSPDTMEEGLKHIGLAIALGFDLIIVDSVAAMIPAKELVKDIQDDSKVGAVAKKLAETLPKIVNWLATHPKTGSGETKKTDPTKPGCALILLNQERAVINTGGSHGPDTNTAGGKALKFYCAVRLRFQKWKTEVIEKTDPLSGKKKKFPYGTITGVTVVKAKMDSRQGQSASIFIRYGFGLDNVYSVIETGVATGVLKKDGAYFSFGENRFQGRDKMRAFFMENPKAFDEAKKLVSAAVVSAGGTAISEEELSDGDAVLESIADLGLDDDDSESTEESISVDDA